MGSKEPSSASVRKWYLHHDSTVPAPFGLHHHSGDCPVESGSTFSDQTCSCSCTDSSQRTFHSGCDEHATTLVLANNSLGYTFGGFAEATWAGNLTYDTTAAGDFLFRLGRGAPAVYRPKPEGDTRYQYRDPGWWPSWGYGHMYYYGRDGVDVHHRGAHAYASYLCLEGTLCSHTRAHVHVRPEPLSLSRAPHPNQARQRVQKISSETIFSAAPEGGGHGANETLTLTLTLALTRCSGARRSARRHSRSRGGRGSCRAAGAARGSAASSAV